ncbi:MAG: M23 family metallopeptidase, partial [Candidatus Eremiobacteraeota bacterium]|nr:M23 family metallopeptidase [Candidatus Eremiobacteraeota bacterium]
EAARIRRLTLRILNVRYLSRIKRARMLASIPSINPAGGAAVAGCFCFRSYPTAEFHLGVDLDANYGDVVRASAAGTVSTSDYDGEFGLKIDIDHHNGYHTWYAHLSRADVHPGEAVLKGQPIALVGSSGRSTGPHLHYQIMHNGQPVDPQPFLKGFPPQVLTSLP